MEPSSRTVVAHLHLFKNAGTSVEQGLQSHFGEDWLSYDKDHPGSRLSFDEALDVLHAQPNVKAFSSHQLRPPISEGGDICFLPLVFLRHPLDRIRSAYEFERKQGGVSPSSRAAAELQLADWIEFHRERNSTQCRNFQTYALTDLRAEGTLAPFLKQPIERHLEAAKAFLGEALAVGLVEDYDASWARIAIWIRDWFPGFNPPPVQANRTAGGSGAIDQRMARLRSEIGEDAFCQLSDDNAGDLELHRWATARATQT